MFFFFHICVMDVKCFTSLQILRHTLEIMTDFERGEMHKFCTDREAKCKIKKKIYIFIRLWVLLSFFFLSSLQLFLN